MDKLPCELLLYVLRYIDQPLDLLRMSCVCKRWRTFIMNDEYFLNQWFSRSQKRSQETYKSHFWCCYMDDIPLWSFDIDLSLFPINLRSSECDILPSTYSEHSCEYKRLFEYHFHLSFFKSSYSFSFWLFLPHQCELDIQIGNSYGEGVNIMFCTDRNYYFDEEKHLSIANRWIHIVLIKINSCRRYRIWIDGQYVSKINQYYLDFDENEQDNSFINFVLHRKFDHTKLETSKKPRIADFIAFNRCLTLVEIHAIHQQQTSIDQVKVGTYMKNNIKYADTIIP